MDATTKSETFGVWLRDLMAERGYPMEGARAGGPSLLARQIGVHRATITRALNGGTIPNASTLKRIADQLEISHEEIFDEAGVEDPGEDQNQTTKPDQGTRESDPDPQVLLGGLHNDQEREIWAITGLTWRERHAAIEAVRSEARRLAAENSMVRGSKRRPA